MPQRALRRRPLEPRASKYRSGHDGSRGNVQNPDGKPDRHGARHGTERETDYNAASVNTGPGLSNVVTPHETFRGDA